MCSRLVVVDRLVDESIVVFTSRVAIACLRQVPLRENSAFERRKYPLGMVVVGKIRWEGSNVVYVRW